MEKNKIVTSLTLAGILTAGVLGGNSNAATKSLGVCKNIITGKDLVPYVLDNANDIITSDRIRAEYTTASNLQLKYSNKVSTGDTFTTASGKKTVIVYGDVNQDGIVDTYDAKLAQKIYLEGDKSTATDVQKAAADVQRNNNSINVDTYDANNIQKFWLQGGEYVKVKPVGVPDDVTTETEYNVTVDAGKGINNQNYKKLKTTLTPTTAFIDETAALKIQAKKLNEETGKYGTPVELTATFASVKANMNSVDVDIDLSKSGLVDITNDTTCKNTNGTYKIQVLRGTTIVAETDVTTHVLPTNTAKPNANVYARRVGSENAEINIVAYGEGTIEKAYCSINSTLNTEAELTDTPGTKLAKEGTPVTVTNNETKTTFTNNELTNNTSYTVYYVLEDSYGNLLHKGTAPVAEDANTNAPIATVKKVEAVNNANQFNVTVEKREFDSDSDGTPDTAFTVDVTLILYKDGKAVAKESVTVPADGNSIATTGENSFKAIMDKEPGTYTVKAIVDGSTTNQPSTPYDSKNNENGTVPIAPLAKATNIELKKVTDPYTGTETEELSWNYAGNEEVNYTVEYKLKAGDWDTPADVTSVSVTNGEKKANFTGVLTANSIYDVRVKVSLKTPDNKLIDSVSDEKQLFTLDFASANLGTVTKTKNSIKLTGVTPVTLTGKGTNATENYVTTYKVKIWNHANSENHTEGNCIIDKDIVLTKEEGKATYESPVIDGLQPGTDYDIYVYAVYDGITSKDNAYNHVSRKTDFNEIAIDFDVDNELSAPKDGKIKVDASGNTAYIGETNVTDTTVFSTEYKAILNNIVAELATGDHVKVSGNDVTITLAKDVTDAVAFGNLKGLNVIVNGSENYRTVSSKAASSKDEDKATSITLKDGLFTAGGVLDSKKVTLDNAKLKSTVANAKYIVANASTINNVEVTGTNVEIAPASGTLTVTPSNSTLEFKNNTQSALTIDVAAPAGNTIDQSGNIIITSEEGDVTLIATNANVTGNVKANVKKGNFTIDALTSNKNISGKVDVTIENNDSTNAGSAILDLTNARLSGEKSVTVVNVKDAKATPAIAEYTNVKGILKTNAPFEMLSALAIKKYNEDDATATAALKAAVKGATPAAGSPTADDIAKAKEIEDAARKFINDLADIIPSTADATIQITEDATTKEQTVILKFAGNINYTLNGVLALK